MKTFVLACFLVASASAAFIPVQQLKQRQRRDVSELVEQPAYSYLPPDAEQTLPEVAEPAVEAVTSTDAELSTEAPAFGDAGYEYRTVRRLKYRYRTARDVSHLAQHYLPPSNEYLPPAESVEHNEAETEPETEEELLVAAPRVANEYLPPVEAAEDDKAQEEAAPSTEATLVEAVVDTEAPLAAVHEAVEPTEPEADAPIDVAPAVEEENVEAEVPQDTAVLADDGYHYKQPAEEEALLKSAAPGEYLPPLEEHVVEAVGPAESAVLADDGYHYRAIKRFRF